MRPPTTLGAKLQHSGAQLACWRGLVSDNELWEYLAFFFQCAGTPFARQFERTWRDFYDEWRGRGACGVAGRRGPVVSVHQMCVH